jgi:hypothetical protein
MKMKHEAVSGFIKQLSGIVSNQTRVAA